MTIFPGERKCDSSVVLIKSHPNLQSFKDITSGNVPEKCKAYVNKLNVFSTSKVIFLIRDPYYAFLGEYQRRITNSHANKVSINYHMRNLKRWKNIIKYLTNKYIDMWTNDYNGFIKSNVTAMVVKYEDLTNLTIRDNILKQMVNFLDLPMPYKSQRIMTSNHNNSIYTCAFKLAAKQKSLYRKVMNRHKDELTGKSNDYITADMVYDRATACEVCN
jgi:hypothetical protein